MRPLRGRRDPLPADHGRAALHRLVAGRDPQQAPRRATAAAVAAQTKPGHPAWLRGGRSCGRWPSSRRSAQTAEEMRQEMRASLVGVADWITNTATPVLMPAVGSSKSVPVQTRPSGFSRDLFAGRRRGLGDRGLAGHRLDRPPARPGLGGDGRGDGPARGRLSVDAAALGARPAMDERSSPRSACRPRRCPRARRRPRRPSCRRPRPRSLRLRPPGSSARSRPPMTPSRRPRPPRSLRPSGTTHGRASGDDAPPAVRRPLERQPAQQRRGDGASRTRARPSRARPPPRWCQRRRPPRRAHRSAVRARGRTGSHA